jgi:acetoin utilization deacetylase AcuC-like enzyme
VSRKLVDRGMVISGGTYECIEHARRDGIALNIAGGTHHAYPGHGEGFCVFNDFSIAANLALQKNESMKILIVDLDVHQGNGTAHIFEQEDRVFTFSMHGERNYPMHKERSNLDIGLPDRTSDDLYLSILQNTLPRLIDRVEPDLIFYLAGVDILATDKLGKLQVSMDGCMQRDRFVLKTCKAGGIPVVVSMGGGYSEHLRTIIEAHANTFRVAADIFT